MASVDLSWYENLKIEGAKKEASKLEIGKKAYTILEKRGSLVSNGEGTLAFRDGKGVKNETIFDRVFETNGLKITLTGRDGVLTVELNGNEVYRQSPIYGSHSGSGYSDNPLRRDYGIADYTFKTYYDRSGHKQRTSTYYIDGYVAEGKWVRRILDPLYNEVMAPERRAEAEGIARDKAAALAISDNKRKAFGLKPLVRRERPKIV